uniref:Uncharacterized protein n=1 Tax=Mucochytrium quahogii TaxID=96639 RepID=A0A7S2WT59_9STRA|mmetsp:Transcript_16256/g.28032  ORF Transcript_16256/g.28032 Transcript_16256/m.28032 type:complete len:173 (+) Transcript_16256:96-614(+)
MWVLSILLVVFPLVESRKLLESQKTYPEELTYVFSELERANNMAKENGMGDMVTFEDEDSSGVNMQTLSFAAVQFNKVYEAVQNNEQEQLVPIEILRRGFETGQTVTQVVSGFLNCPESSTNRTLFELCTESCKCLPGLTCSTQREQLTETFKAQLVTQPKFEQFRVGKCLI